MERAKKLAEWKKQRAAKANAVKGGAVAIKGAKRPKQFSATRRTSGQQKENNPVAVPKRQVESVSMSKSKAAPPTLGAAIQSPKPSTAFTRRMNGARRVSDEQSRTSSGSGSGNSSKSTKIPSKTTGGGAMRRLGLGGRGSARRVSESTNSLEVDRRGSTESFDTLSTAGVSFSSALSPAPTARRTSSAFSRRMSGDGNSGGSVFSRRISDDSTTSVAKTAGFAGMRARRHSGASHGSSGSVFDEDLDNKPTTTTAGATRKLAPAVGFMPSASIPAVVKRVDTTANEATVDTCDQPAMLETAPLNDTNRDWELADFAIGRALGKGKFGNVYLAQQKTTKVALKCLFKTSILQEVGSVQILQREVCVASKVCILSPAPQKWQIIS